VERKSLRFNYFTPPRLVVATLALLGLGFLCTQSPALNSLLSSEPPRPAAPELAATDAILDAASLDPNRPIPVGGWFIVRGSNLAPESREWIPADLEGDRAPTSLLGVSVSVGGKPAYLVSLRNATQEGLEKDEIIAVAPRLPAGPSPVIVTTPGGSTAQATANFADLSPALFSWSPLDHKYVEAATANGAEWIGPLNLFGSKPLSRPIRPAVEAEIISFFVNGCGELETATPEGTLAKAANPAKLPATVLIGETSAEVVYAGAAVGRLATCEVRVKMPALGSNDYDVVVTIGDSRLEPVRQLSVRTVDYPGFEHGAQSKFRLTGAHVFVECTQCHQRSRFWGTPSACEACHLDRYQTAQSPNHGDSGFPTNCTLCHQTSQFRGARGGHSASAFPMTGKHGLLECASCHKGGAFSKLDSSCVTCHRDTYNATTSPNHASVGYGTGCSVCHNPTGWKGALTDHSRTGFALTGKHSTLECSACHVAGQTTKPDKACASCHVANYNATTNPNHAASGYPTGCDACHTTTAFRPASVDHPRQRFPLSGGHATLQCAQCHKDGQLSGLNGTCSTCHLPQFNATTNPNHAAAGFPQTCDSCHTTAGWKGAANRHERFPLTGKHTQTACLSCHADNRFAGTPAVCSSCHLPRYEATTNPNHRANSYPLDCQLCHSTSQFKGARFAHISFPLNGRHSNAQCSQCHSNGTYAGTSRDCSSCHTSAYTASANPNHAAAGYPTTCQNCHTPAGWRPASFAHTSFALTGRHTTVQCSQCHASGTYAGTSTACSSCHTAAYTAAANPNHAAAGYPTTCQNCHTPAGWRPASFAHTRFALTGRHTTVQCSQCHASGTYAGTPTACSSCHTAAYTAAANPNHAAAGYPTTCQNCHTPAGWRPASFAHTSFALTGRHTTVQCSQCHASGTYAGTPNTCASCHLSRYQSVTSPNHAAQEYPTRCETCHTPAAWRPSTFAHRFPITTGKHAGKWTRCTQCHVDASNFAVFSCLTCHTQRSTDSDHHDVARYDYSTAKCYSCHPQGRKP
jgi:uncharacterized protein (TIGR03437 family)